MALLLDQEGLESPLKQMPHPAMSLVEGLGIDPIQLPHPQGEVPLRCLDEEMVMVLHKAVGMTEPVVASIHLVQKIEKGLPVLIIREDGPLVIASIGEVIDGPGALNAEWSDHQRKISDPKGHAKKIDLTPF